MKRNQTAHEALIPLLVDIVGAKSYLELGTHQNETIGHVRCENRYGVDRRVVHCQGAIMFEMETGYFIRHHADKYGPYDFVFIDADHNRESVADDFFGILPFVSDEGIIALHDTNPETVQDATPGYCGNAWEFAQHITEGGWEAMTLPYHPGLTLVRKRLSWGPKP